MSTAEATTVITAEELFARGSSERAELIRGELVEMSPTGFEHGRFISKVATAFVFYLDKNPIGEWVTGETGFILERDPDTVRAPDLAFLAADRVPSGPHPKFRDGTPTIAVEIVSPADRLTEVMQKADQWLNAGCQSVWLIDPQREKATICRLADGQLQATDTDEIVEPELLPGFALDTATLWQR